MSNTISDPDSFLYMMKKTFVMMTLSKSRSYYPVEIISSLGIDPHIQNDVHEFLDILLTSLKQSLQMDGQTNSTVLFSFVLSHFPVIISNCLNPYLAGD